MARMETPEGGIYTLPPLLMSVESLEQTLPHSVPLKETVPRPPTPEPRPPTPEPRPSTPEPPHRQKQEPEKEEEDTKQIEPVGSLSSVEAWTQCPTCNKVVLSRTKKFNGESVWLMCCICSLLGGVVGFCLIPFCLDRVKSVRHKCPECEATIHTYHPF